MDEYFEGIRGFMPHEWYIADAEEWEGVVVGDIWNTFLGRFEVTRLEPLPNGTIKVYGTKVS